MTQEIEEALCLLYGGQTNVAVKANELGLPLKTLKSLLNDYIRKNPMTEDAWNGDIQLSWPYVT